jgi:curli biogenesis system outer membrane secretion channel CsgG
VDAGVLFADAVTSGIMRLDRYSVRERSQIEKVLREQDLKLADLVEKGEYQKIGRLAGVDGIVVGNVAMANMAVKDTGIKPAIQVEQAFVCRLINTKTGDVMWSIGGSKSITWADKIAPWGGQLVEEVVAELKKNLETRPRARP